MPSYCLRFFAILFILVVAACGKANDKSPCADVTCDGGVCDADTGECVNPGICGDLTICLNGYECVQSQCVTEFACNIDGSCDRGECVDGEACVNPARCDADIDCVPGYACDGDQCIQDRCDVVECASGVCEKETGECVNAAVCTASTQETDCIEGFRCYDQSCADEATVCADLGCERGECSFLDLACTNPEDCAGDDLNCLEGYFCNAVNQCQQNVCDSNGTTCPRGVCEAATGSCVNDDPCSAGSSCVDGFYCVSGSCLPSAEACEVCAGNQQCSYDDGTTSVVCDENPNGCSTSLDCIGSRECESGTCGAPQPCTADGFEPNDSLATAINWFDVNANPVRGSVCRGDEDFFSFDVADDPEFTGTLIALVTIPAADVGVGTLTLELFNSAGTVVASTTSLPTDQFVRLDYVIGNINQGVYTLAIRDDSVGDGGIDYDLFMDLADTATVNICQSARVLGNTQMGDTSISTSNSLGSNCAFDATATEEAWLLELASPSYVTLTLQSTAFDGLISVRGQCEADASEIACVNNNISTGSEALGVRLDAGSYFVVIQGSGGSASGAYTLNVATEAVVCTSSDNTCSNMTTARACNSRGTGFDTVACDSGCDAAIGACIREAGDVCSVAIDATNGFSGQIGLGLLRNDYNPGPTCVPPGFSTVTDGPEGVFSITLQPSDVLYATAAPVDFDDVGIYLVSDCVDVASSCLAGVNDADFSGDEDFLYVNMTAQAQDVFLVVDSESGSLGAVDVEIVVGPSLCTPGSQQCNGAMLETCNIAGTAYTGRSCAFGCDMATTACVPPANEMCGAGAIDVSAGGTFTGVIEDYANDYSSTSACTGGSSNGADAVFSLVGTPGDIVDVTLSGSYDRTLYAVTDCGNIAGTCLDGVDGFSSSTPEVIQFAIPDTNPVYIVADAYYTTASGTFTLTVDIRSPDCATPGQAIACKPDGVTLQYCDDLGFFADYTCATTCTGVACDEPTGDRCFDAVPLIPGTQAAGDFSDYDDTVNPGLGTCIFGTGSQVGPDTIYRVDLLAGDLLTAALTTTSSSAGMYVFEDCDSPRDSCLIGAARSKNLVFFAPTTKAYYLVVDSTYAFSSEAWTLDVSVAPGYACQPGATSCNAGLLTSCSADGLTVEGTSSCARGCENSRACAGPAAPNDTCTTADIISGSTTIADTWGRFTNVLDPGQTSMNTCSISSFNSDGPEAIYAVPLGAGDVVDVTVDDLGGTGSPQVYIATDCTDPESSCVAADTKTTVARAAHISDLGGTVYVVVDNTIANSSSSFVVDIDVRASQCASNLHACADSMTREYCDPFGYRQTEDCFFGCITGDCAPPTNDTCTTPTPLTSGVPATVSWQGFMSDFGDTLVACTDDIARGPDAVFSFTANANDVVTATMTGATSDASLWISSTCGDATTCLAGADAEGTGSTETLIFAVPTTGTYYLVADSYSTTTSGTFTVEVNVAAPLCAVPSTMCDQAGTGVEACNRIGSAVELFTCDVAGCSTTTGLCVTADGEVPVSAINANALGTFMGTFSNFANDFDLVDATSCTNYDTPGPEAAYFVDLMMGQTLTAKLTGTDDTALYILDNPADPDRSCVIGKDSFGSGETVSFTAPANMRVYVIADAYDDFATGAFTLDLSMN